MDISVLLQTIGLDENEASILTVLFQIKEASALEIAKRSGVKRATVYLVLERLRKKRLVRISTFHETKRYRANDIGALKQYLVRQKNQVDQLLPRLRTRYEIRNKKVRLRRYKGVGGIKTLCEKIVRERKPLYFFGDINAWYGVLGLYADFFKKRAQQVGVTIRHKFYKSNAWMILWSDKVVFITNDDVIEAFGCKNQIMYDLYKELWDNY